MAGPDHGRGGATVVLGVLTAINFLNYLDRYVLSAVLDPLQGELRIDDDAAGLLGTAFMVVYMLAAPLGGHFGDRASRHKIAAAGVALWSLATIASGLAQDYTTLLLSRAAVGIGEAGYATVAPSVIADLYRPAERGRKLAYFYLAIPVGSALGYVLGGAIGAEYGWRAAFFVAGAPGLAMALVIARLREPARGQHDEGEVDSEPVALRAALSRVLSSPAWRTTTIGMTLMTFAMGGIAFWMPTFLVREHDLPLDDANFTFGALTVVAGLVGTLVGGLLGDRAQARGEGGYLRVSGWGLLLGAPIAAAMPFAGAPSAVFALAFAAELLLFLNTGPLNAALVACVPPMLRARAVAINVFFIHALGDAVSPWIMGGISEGSSLGMAIAITGVPIALGGLVLLLGAAPVERRGGLLAR